MAAWLLTQAECFLCTGFAPAGAGQARPCRHAYRLPGPDKWLVIALQTHVYFWEIAVYYGATAAAPNSPVPGPAGSEARGQARWVGGVVWFGDLAGALAAARRVSGPLVREERRWLSLARWAAQQPGAGRRGYVGVRPPHDRGLVEASCPRRRWRLKEGRV